MASTSRFTSPRGPAALLGAIALAVIASACSPTDGGPTPAGTAQPTGFAHTVDRLLDEARSARVSQEQIAVLEKWRNDGDAQYSDVVILLESMFACFEEAGLSYSYSAPAGSGDYPEIEYLVTNSTGLSDEAARALVDECERTQLGFASTAYQLGPGVSARRDQEEAAAFPAAIACVEDMDIVVPDNVTTLTELAQYLASSDLTEALACTV